jgi:23S rRNA (pseudouridine1915-N3)-methyltransferase
VKLWIVAAGRLRDPPLRELCDRYLSRLRRYVSTTEIEAREARDLVRSIPERATLVTLEANGEALNSRAFATRLEAWLDGGSLAFVIGAAEGLPEAVNARAAHRISLSPLTMPHRLARVVLFEQLYRAMTILRGEPYARED